jgi:hypothetical protein
MEMSGQLHAPAALPKGKNSGIHGRKGQVGSKDGLRSEKSLSPVGIQTPDRPAQSLITISIIKQTVLCSVNFVSLGDNTFTFYIPHLVKRKLS